MRNFVVLLISFFFLTCSNSDESTTLAVESNKVVLLKVDFTTLNLEGAKELTFEEDTDDFTISFDYQSPGDFGSIKLFYQQLGQLIFDGSIIWLGLGEIAFPVSFINVENLNTIDNPVEAPPVSLFQNVLYDEFAYYPEDLDYMALWDAVDNLELVSEYRLNNPDAAINVFLYTPSVGVGNPLDWDYFIILKN